MNPFSSQNRKTANELQAFLPGKMYDIHGSILLWRKQLSQYLGDGRLYGALFSSATEPFAESNQGNDDLVEQLEKEPQSRGLVVVRPDDSLDRVAKYLKYPQIAGLKPYHVDSKGKPNLQSSIVGLCPDWMWEFANEHNLAVMLQLVKDSTVADPENIRDIRDICKRYPRVKLLLSHYTLDIEGISGLENVWFDTSAVSKPEVLKALLRHFGPRKILWGSDFPLHLGFEPLWALKEAADDFGLSDDDLDDIFYRNAARFLGLEEETGQLTQDLYEHAKRRIPGGVQLLSKRPENMAPGRWPAYFREARGCEVWDLDGKHYYDMSTNAVGSCLLGFRDPDVTRAVVRRANLGSMSSLNAPEEVELADLLCEIHPWADQVRFTRGGGDSCAVAVRIARAATDRSIVAVCGYHGWQDWYLAANLGETDALRGHLLSGLNPLGVPRELRGTTVTFKYNDRAALQTIVDQYGSSLAAVIMEPCRNGDPEPGFLEFVREMTKRCGAVLIFDEITIGWRLHYGGAHMKFGVTPDIAVFAKAMGNGHPIGAVIGTEEAMQGAYESFISSTYWTESIGPAAAIATIRKLGRLHAHEHVKRAGSRIEESWERHGEKYGLPITTRGGYPCLAHFAFRHQESEKLRTLYTQLMLDRGFLAGTSIYPTLAHNDDIIDLYDTAIDEVYGEIATALKSGDVDGMLKGNVAFSGFQRLL